MFETKRDPALAATGVVVALALILVVAGAWGFQILGDLAPCPLCLIQRWPYYIGAPFALLLAYLSKRGAPAVVLRGGGVLLAALLLWSVGMGVFHAGVEWHFWPGPTTCGTAQAISTSAGDLLARMQRTTVVQCDEAAWRFLGISLAGYNALISAGLFGLVVLTLSGLHPMARRAQPA